MGLCRDFGSQISEGCGHLMRADSDSCHCDQCGVVCKGRFEACPAVWAQGPQPPVAIRPAAPLLPSMPVKAHANGEGPGTQALSSGPPPAVAAEVATNGSTSPEAQEPAHSQPAPTATAPGAEVLRWFQDAFDALRLEVEGLRSALSQEQALVATLIESRTVEPALDTESLRSLVDAVVRESIGREATSLHTEVTTTVEALRSDIDTIKQAHHDQVTVLQSAIATVGAAQHEHATGLITSLAAVSGDSAGLQASIDAVAAAVSGDSAGLQASIDAVAAAVSGDSAGLQASIDAVAAAVSGDSAGLKASIDAVAADSAATRESMAAIVASSARLPADLNRRDAALRRALRTTLREELQPLVDVVAESVAQSDFELKAIGSKLDHVLESEASLSAALAEAVRSTVTSVAEVDATQEEGPAGDARPRRFPFADRPAGANPAVAAGVASAGASEAPAATRGLRVSLRRPPPAA